MQIDSCMHLLLSEILTERERESLHIASKSLKHTHFLIRLYTANPYCTSKDRFLTLISSAECSFSFIFHLSCIIKLRGLHRIPGRLLVQALTNLNPLISSQGVLPCVYLVSSFFFLKIHLGGRIGKQFSFPVSSESSIRWMSLGKNRVTLSCPEGKMEVRKSVYATPSSLTKR